MLSEFKIYRREIQTYVHEQNVIEKIRKNVSISGIKLSEKNNL